jgi:hypothetical protein
MVHFDDNKATQHFNGIKCQLLGPTVNPNHYKSRRDGLKTENSGRQAPERDGMGIDIPLLQTPARVRRVNKESGCVSHFH